MKSCTPFPRRGLKSAKKFHTATILLVFCALIALGAGQSAAHGPAKKNNTPETVDPAKPAPSAPAQQHGHGGDSHSAGDKSRLGETVYKHMCVFCHGEDGNGGGKAMAYLYPWPRDFRKGVYKFKSTPSGSLPLDSDIYRTIAKGVPGTAMPAWGDALSDEETKSVVEYLKSFSDRFKNEKPKAPIDLGETPETTQEATENGKRLYREMRCARCHGTDLKGEGALADQLYDIWDHRAFIYDLTNPNTYKFGYEKEQIHLTLVAGIDGTPMKSYSHLNKEERWDLAAYVRSKIDMDKLEESKYETDLYSKLVDDEIDMDPDNPIWKNIPVHDVHMLPLSARKSPVNRIRLQSVRNEEGIAFRVQWQDPVSDKHSSRHQDFKDAVALQFALGDVLLHTHGHNEPFFGMGNRGKTVNIWQWRADWQTEIETKEKLEYATKGMDLDVMIFGGEVNPVDALNPFRDVPVEELNAEGFGTLTPQPQTKQNVLGNGAWKAGVWTVVFYRTLDSLNKWDVKFVKEQPILMGFAVWDGAHQDRNGRKVISMWQRLHVP